MRYHPGARALNGRLGIILLAVSIGAVLLLLALTPGATAGSGGGISAGGESDGSNAVFPVRGPHTYGDGFGAGRNHQGQDLLADCGTKIVAARDGRVRVRDFHGSGAGNFVVIRRAGKSSDDVYMHMRGPASVAEGERVEAGDAIGKVGSTGRSTACHLHFEIWSPPGWYSGGEPIDPTPSLKRWDRAT